MASGDSSSPRSVLLFYYTIFIVNVKGCSLFFFEFVSDCFSVASRLVRLVHHLRTVAFNSTDGYGCQGTLGGITLTLICDTLGVAQPTANNMPTNRAANTIFLIAYLLYTIVIGCCQCQTLVKRKFFFVVVSACGVRTYVIRGRPRINFSY